MMGNEGLGIKRSVTKGQGIPEQEMVDKKYVHWVPLERQRLGGEQRSTHLVIMTKEKAY